MCRQDGGDNEREEKRSFGRNAGRVSRSARSSKQGGVTRANLRCLSHAYPIPAQGRFPIQFGAAAELESPQFKP
jgi:hypothetical protein